MTTLKLTADRPAGSSWHKQTLNALCVLIGLFSPLLYANIETLQTLRDSDPEALLVELDQRLEAASPETPPGDLAQMYRMRAEMLRDRGEYAAAARDVEQFQRLAQQINDPILISRGLMLLGTLDAEQNNIADALDRFHEARRLLEAHGESTELARINNAIGVAHNFTFNYERARHYYEEALRLARQVGDAGVEASALGNLALAVSELEGPEAGLTLHRQAMALAQQRGDSHGVALQLANICQRVMQTADSEQALQACTAAHEVLEALRLARPLAGVLMTLGDLASSKNFLQQAIEHYQAALVHARGVVPTVELQLYRKLSHVHAAMDDNAAALMQLQAAVTLNEELRQRERQTAVEELEVRYQVAQRERELELLQLSSTLQATELRQRTMLLAAAAVATLLALLVAAIAWHGYRTEVRLEQKLAARNQALELALEQISRLAQTDPLTGLWNRRAFEDLATREIHKAARAKQPLALVMADIDNFKPLNDQYGHEVGDEVLKDVAKQLRQALRGVDLIGRWGGEEFLCLLPDSDANAAAGAMERIRQQLANQPLDIAGRLETITMTYGIAMLDKDLGAAIKAADGAMYQGKRAGRDRIVIAEQDG